VCASVSLSLSLSLHLQLPCSSVAGDAKRGKADPCVVSWSCTLEVVAADAALTLHTFFSKKGSARGSYIFYLGGINVILFLTLPSTLPRVRCCAPPPRVRARECVAEQYPPPAAAACSPCTCTPYSTAALLFLEIQVTEQKK
jgi:hypothetical protein